MPLKKSHYFYFNYNSHCGERIHRCCERTLWFETNGSFFIWTFWFNDWENVWRVDYNDGLKSKSINEILLDSLLYDHLISQINGWRLFDWNIRHLFTANNQTNDRLAANESRSSAIASSSNARTLIGNVNSTNQTTFRSATKPTTFDGSNEQKQTESNGGVDDDDLASVHLMLEPHLRPAPPDPKSDLSKQIFDEHKQLAKEYLKVFDRFRFEIILLASNWNLCSFFSDSYWNCLCEE